MEFLWEALLTGKLDWVVSDHACCRHETKIPKRYFGNIWMAKSGFGGTEYLLPALVSEGTRRGMGYNHMARVTSWNPAQRYGLNRKGDIAEGLDADLALVDPRETWTIRAGESWALLGPNGSGKTTLLSLILGDNPQVYTNDIVVFGRPRGTGESVWEIRKHIGWVSPELHLHFQRLPGELGP